MCSAENGRAVREAGGDRPLGGRARTDRDSGVPGGAIVADGLRRASAGARTARRRCDSGPAGGRRAQRSVGMLEVFRPTAPRWGVVQSQAGASRVLRAAPQSAATDAEANPEMGPATARSEEHT